MPGPAAGVALFASSLGILSYFGVDPESDTDRALNDIKRNLDDLENDITGTVIVQNIAASLGSTHTALSQLAAYAAEENAFERSLLKSNAINDAERALNEIIEQVETSRDGANFETLAYCFAALHFATLVRMNVAEKVEDGPLGAPKLHETVKKAAKLLDDPGARNDLVEDMFQQLDASITSYTSDGIADRLLQRVGVYANSPYGDQQNEDYNEPQGYIPNPVLPWLLIKEAYSTTKSRAEAALSTHRSELFNEIQEITGFNDLREAGREMNDYLNGNIAAIDGLNEKILTSLSETAVGTDIADYLSGLGGDDHLSGEGGPDAVSGGSGNDILRGGSFHDMLVGGDGNDFIIGGNAITDSVEGGDVARFSGLASEYEVTGGTEYTVVTGPDGERDKVFNVSFLQFDDTRIELGAGSALDGAGKLEDFETVESLALLYEAALDRDGNLDRSGLNFWYDVTEDLQNESGYSEKEAIEFVAYELMTSPEFTSTFGNVSTMTNDMFVETIYDNVLDREIDPSGRDFYVDHLDNGVAREIILADIAISEENAAGSREVLMSIYEASTPEYHPNTGILLDWYFVA